MPTFSSCSKMRGFIDGRLPIIGTMLIDSVPPAIITSASPTRMRSAAMASAVSPEAQKRFTVTPATVCGSPASSTDRRATFRPCSASGMAQPMIASSISWGSSAGACPSAARIAATRRSSGRVLRNTPRGALPIGVRAAATMYASWTCRVMKLLLSVPHRLAGLHHPHDPLLGLRMVQQRDEGLALQPQHPGLVHQRPRLDVAAAHHLGDGPAQMEVVRRDEPAV